MPSKKPLFIFLLLFCSLGYDAQAQKVVEDRWAGKKIPFAIKPDKETVELLGFGEYDDKDPRVSSILFKKRINFNYTQFPKWANFLGAQFSKEADFNFTRFPKGANFTDTQFSEKASFRNARFLKEADFSSSQFSEEAHFNAIEFLVNTSFVWTKFSREVNFSDAQFSEGANFIWTQFPERAFLLKVQFSKEASFYMAQFSKWANFDFSHFEGSVDFNGSELPDILYFRGVTSKEIIRLDYASTDSLHKRQNNTNAKCKLFLNTSSSLDKFVLDANKFELAFDSTKYPVSSLFFMVKDGKAMVTTSKEVVSNTLANKGFAIDDETKKSIMNNNYSIKIDSKKLFDILGTEASTKTNKKICAYMAENMGDIKTESSFKDGMVQGTTTIKVNGNHANSLEFIFNTIEYMNDLYEKDKIEEVKKED